MSPQSTTLASRSGRSVRLPAYDSDGRVRPFGDVAGIDEVLRKLQVAVKIAQGRIVLVEPWPSDLGICGQPGGELPFDAPEIRLGSATA